MAVEELAITLDNVRSIVGEPLMPLEACAICREMPDSCSRFLKAGDVEHDNIPSAAAHIQPFLSFGPQVRTTWIGRCPTCHRTYLCVEEYEFIMGGGEDTKSYLRVDADRIAHLPELKRHADAVFRATGAGWQIEPRTVEQPAPVDDEDDGGELPFAVWDPPTP